MAETRVLLKPDSLNHCFACGGANARGMRLTFEQDDAKRRIRGLFRLSADYQGASGFAHGGIIATLLDEAMGKVSRFNGETAVTAELTVEYRRPVPIDEDIVVEGWEVKVSERHRFREAEIRHESGMVLARGRARFTVIDPERFAASGGTKS
ncbi:MAG TPA: PaaI family thioesterase [Candidatus Aquilonibacter sp.]|nr:PaaI family thioesterase [Candidatus Aquilonibacter sp.]